MYRDGGYGPDIVFHSSNGTIASPTASANTELLGNITSAEYEGTSLPKKMDQYKSTVDAAL